MNEISVVMASYNAEMYIGEAIESVLKQSFSDFEFIIVDDGSTDNTKDIIRSYADKRIKLIENKHDYVESLNLGMNVAKGKYIARMDSDDIMHIDRLKIQYTIMEEEPDITVCSSWMSLFGNNIPKGAISQTVSGWIENPMLLFLKGNFIFHPTTIIRTGFLWKHSLQYDNYECAEDYRLWVEVAKRGGHFYVDPQPLLYYRVSEQQISYKKQDMQSNTSSQIKQEILDYLLGLNANQHPSLEEVYHTMLCVEKEKLITQDDIVAFFYTLYLKNKNSLITDL